MGSPPPASCLLCVSCNTGVSEETLNFSNAPNFLVTQCGGKFFHPPADYQHAL